MARCPNLDCEPRGVVKATTDIAGSGVSEMPFFDPHGVHTDPRVGHICIHNIGHPCSLGHCLWLLVRLAARVLPQRNG